MVREGRGKAAVGGYWVKLFNEPHFVPPILELVLVI